MLYTGGQAAQPGGLYPHRGNRLAPLEGSIRGMRIRCGVHAEHGFGQEERELLKVIHL